MRRAMFIALGIGAIVTSAAAIGFNSAGSPQSASAAAPTSKIEMRRAEAAARDAQRARIDQRYEAERAQCESVSGVRHDRCLINAHVHRGRALLEAAAPYQTRS